MDGMMSKSGLYTEYPIYYVQELKAVGRRDMAMAFMDYWDDYKSERRGFGKIHAVRYYAKAWHNSYLSRGKVSIGMSPDTASKWIVEFKEIIEKFEATIAMWGNAQKEIMDRSVQKSIGQQSDNNRTKKEDLKSETVGSNKNQSSSNRTSIGQNNKNKNRLSSKQKFSKDDIRLSNLLFNYLREINPNHKQPNIDNWANSCRLMRDRDERSVEQIENMMKFIFTNSGAFGNWDGTFWKSNVLSMGKLREKYDQISIQIRESMKRSA